MDEFPAVVEAEPLDGRAAGRPSVQAPPQLCCKRAPRVPVQHRIAELDLGLPGETKAVGQMTLETVGAPHHSGAPIAATLQPQTCQDLLIEHRLVNQEPRELEAACATGDADTDPVVGLDAVMRRDGTISQGLGTILEQLGRWADAGAVKTPMHSSKEFALPIVEYASSLYWSGCFTCETLVLAMIYLDRLTKRNLDVEVSPHTCHRLLASCLLVATKYHQDNHNSNRFYAQLFQLSVQDLNALERYALCVLGYFLVVDRREFEAYRRVLLRAGGQR